MIKTISKNDLVSCITSVKNAGDKDRSIVNYSEASILILFVNNYVENNSLILMTKRKNNLRKHAGQIAFPGGRKERQDKDLKDTVQRETEEEVNISKDNYDIIGKLPKFYTGTVGMARSMSPDSGDSQFFICFDGCSHLTGQYTVWGQVISGMEAVEKLSIGEPPSNPDKMISVRLGKK